MLHANLTRCAYGAIVTVCPLRDESRSSSSFSAIDRSKILFQAACQRLASSWAQEAKEGTLSCINLRMLKFKDVGIKHSQLAAPLLHISQGDIVSKSSNITTLYKFNCASLMGGKSKKSTNITFNAETTCHGIEGQAHDQRTLEPLGHSSVGRYGMKLTRISLL